MKNECNQEQEKNKILEVQNEIFENIMRDYAIEVNEKRTSKIRKRKIKRRKRRAQK